VVVEPSTAEEAESSDDEGESRTASIGHLDSRVGPGRKNSAVAGQGHDPWYCRVCNRDMVLSAKDEHERGKKHLKAVRQAAAVRAIATTCTLDARCVAHTSYTGGMGAQVASSSAPKAPSQVEPTTAAVCKNTPPPSTADNTQPKKKKRKKKLNVQPTIESGEK
jgi:hypothetical protein